MSSSRDCDIYGVAVNIPPEFADRLMDAIDSVMEPVYPGYRRCFYYYPVKGTWKTMESAKPYDGVPGEITVADEIRIKFVCREGDIAAVLQKIREVHPYEEPAIDVVPQIGWKELIPSL